MMCPDQSFVVGPLKLTKTKGLVFFPKKWAVLAVIFEGL